MLLFIGYLIAAGISGYIFRFVAGLFEAVVILPIFGIKNSDISYALLEKPRRFITAIIFKNVIIGLANSIMILRISVKFVVDYNGNYWLYFVLGLFWSFLIIGYNEYFSGIFFFSSTVNFALMWFGFGIYSLLLIGFITFLVGIAYYFGRIGALQQIQRNEIE